MDQTIRVTAFEQLLGGVVVRHQSHVVTAAILLMLSGPGHASESLLLDKLAKFYDGLHVCSAATIDSMTHNGQSAIVELTVETATANALKSMKKHERDNWLALHCPPEYPYFYKNDTDLDVDIQANSTDSNFATLSCSDFYEGQSGQRQETKRGALERLFQNLK